MVDVLNTGKWTPQMALLEAQNIQEDMEHVAVIWLNKGDVEGTPHLTCSTMRPVDMNFLGFALQQHSLKKMTDD